MTPGVGNLVLGRRPQSTFYVNVRPWPYLGILNWVPFFLDMDDIKKVGVGAIWCFVTPQGSFNLVRMRCKKGLF